MFDQINVASVSIREALKHFFKWIVPISAHPVQKQHIHTHTKSINFNSENTQHVFLTKVIVAHHGIRSTQAWALLGEMVSEFQQSSVLLQNVSYLHLNLITQRLALYHTYTDNIHVIY